MLAVGAWGQAAQQGKLGQTDGSRVAAVDESLDLIERRLADKPGDLRLSFQRGLALSKLERHGEAVAVFQRLIIDHPTLAAAYNNLGVLYAAQSDLGAARQSLEAAVRVDPGYALAYENLGDLHLQFAVQAYDRSVRLDRPNTLPVLKLEQVQALLNPVSRVLPPTVTALATPRRLPGQESDAAGVQTRAEPRAHASPSEALQQVVQAWRVAWSQRDAESYLAHYAANFKGSFASRAIWQEWRTARIRARSRIAVALSDLTIDVDDSGRRATARFLQAYESDGPKDLNRKTLEFAQGTDGRWMIVGESAHPEVSSLRASSVRRRTAEASKRRGQTDFGA